MHRTTFIPFPPRCDVEARDIRSGCRGTESKGEIGWAGVQERKGVIELADRSAVTRIYLSRCSASLRWLSTISGGRLTTVDSPRPQLAQHSLESRAVKAWQNLIHPRPRLVLIYSKCKVKSIGYIFSNDVCASLEISSACLPR